MEEAEIKFEREDLTGVIPVGTYLAAAAGRMGVDLASEPFGDTEAEFSVIKITQGGDLLSAPTKFETEQLSDHRLNGGERLAEHAKIERAGEITIMTTKKEEPAKPDYEVKKEAYRKDFEELPLEKKIASLVELEAIALGDTFSFIINSPSMIVGKFVDVLAEMGFKLEDEAKKQSRPADHQPPETSVKDEADTEDPLPSVTDKTDTEDPLPSITEEDKTTDEAKNPPPST